MIFRTCPYATEQTFADVLVKFGSLANLAAKCHQNIKNIKIK